MEADDSGFFEGFSGKRPLLKVFNAGSIPTPPPIEEEDVVEKKNLKKKSSSVTKKALVHTHSEAHESNKDQLQTDVSWFDMGLCKPLIKAVCEIGFVAPTPIQVKAIPAIMNGYDVCARAVTGSGKTAAFLLPVLHRVLTTPPPNRQCVRVLILTPTRELAVQCMEMKDTLTQFCRQYVVSCISIGGVPKEAQAQQLKQNPDIVIATPGRMIEMLRNQSGVSLESLQVLVFDEADKMLSAGYAELVEEILEFCPKKRQTLLFSATMTRDVDTLAKLALERPMDIDIGHVAVASQLTQEFIRLTDEEKRSKIAMLHVLVTKIYPSKTVVFAKFLTTVRRLKVALELMGVSVVALHGLLSMEDRLKSLELFGTGQAAVMIATELAARGLDIPGVETVVNYDMPITLTSYIHRVGRTARIGHMGRAVSFVGPYDEEVLAKIMRLSDSSVGGVVSSVKKRELDSAEVKASQVLVDQVFDEVREVLKSEDLEKDIEKVENRVKREMYHDSIGGRDLHEHNEESESWFETKQEKRARETRSKQDYKNKMEDEAVPLEDYTQHHAVDIEGPKKKSKKTASQQYLEHKDQRELERKKNKAQLKKVKSALDLKGLIPKGKFKRVRKTEERRRRRVAIANGEVKARPSQRRRGQRKSDPPAKKKGGKNFKSKGRYKRR